MQITTDNLFLAYLKSRTLHEHLLTADTLLRYTHGKVPPDSPIIRAKAARPGRACATDDHEQRDIHGQDQRRHQDNSRL